MIDLIQEPAIDALGTPVLVTYFQTGMVPQYPSLFVASFMLVISCLGLMAGLVLDGIRTSRHESSRLSYMTHPAIRDAYVSDPAPSVAALLQQVRGEQAEAARVRRVS